MAYLLRVLDNKSRWDKSRDELPWLNNGSLVADVFWCLRTKDGGLSTYLVDTDESNLSRVIAAFACKRDSLQKIDYALIPADVVESSFKLKATMCETPDAMVNEWHRDIVELTAEKLLDLARVVDSCQEKDNMRRYPKWRVEEAIIDSVSKEYIDCDKVKLKRKSKFCT